MEEGIAPGLVPDAAPGAMFEHELKTDDGQKPEVEGQDLCGQALQRRRLEPGEGADRESIEAVVLSFRPGGLAKAMEEVQASVVSFQIASKARVVVQGLEVAENLHLSGGFLQEDDVPPVEEIHQAVGPVSVSPRALGHDRNPSPVPGEEIQDLTGIGEVGPFQYQRLGFMDTHGFRLF